MDNRPSAYEAAKARLAQLSLEARAADRAMKYELRNRLCREHDTLALQLLRREQD